MLRREVLHEFVDFFFIVIDLVNMVKTWKRIQSPTQILAVNFNLLLSGLSYQRMTINMTESARDEPGRVHAP